MVNRFVSYAWLSVLVIVLGGCETHITNTETVKDFSIAVWMKSGFNEDSVTVNLGDRSVGPIVYTNDGVRPADGVIFAHNSEGFHLVSVSMINEQVQRDTTFFAAPDQAVAVDVHYARDTKVISFKITQY